MLVVYEHTDWIALGKDKQLELLKEHLPIGELLVHNNVEFVVTEYILNGTFYNFRVEFLKIPEPNKIKVLHPRHLMFL